MYKVGDLLVRWCTSVQHVLTTYGAKIDFWSKATKDPVLQVLLLKVIIMVVHQIK